MSTTNQKPLFLLGAGAPDTDREAWLAERRQGVTATEVAGLAQAKNLDKAIDTLIREKINGEHFAGNAWTEWGKERESVLEDFATFKHGYTPEKRVIHCSARHELMASPDGWRLNADGTVSLVELKTSGKRLNWKEAQAKGYIDQVQVQLFVCDAQNADLIWEERKGSIDGGFIPGIRGIIPIPRDDDRIGELLVIVDKFMSAYTAALVNGIDADQDPFLDDLLNRLDRAKADVKTLDAEAREWIEKAGVGAISTRSWSVSYTQAKAPDVADDETFTIEHPDLAQRRTELLAELDAIKIVADGYKKPGNPPKPTLRITARKDAA